MQSIERIRSFSDEILNALGPGYKENIYVNAMCVHLSREKYLFATEVIVPIDYLGVQIGYERADIVIYEPIKCILEFKAQTQSVSKKEFTQLKKYLKNLDNGVFKNGILINFGNFKNSLEFHEINQEEEVLKPLVSINID